MISTIENPVKKKPRELESKSKNEPLSRVRRDKKKQDFSLLRAGLVIISLSMAIAFSAANGNLFLKELVVSSFIILILMTIKLLELKKI